MKRPAGAPLAHPRDPLHGITLKAIVEQLVERHGWAEMGGGVQSSLAFLRKTPWARKKVEGWFLAELLKK